MEMSAMGKRFQQIREEVGLSQPELAAAAGVPVDTLRNWEHGRRVPSLVNAVRVATALGISLDRLAGLDETPAPKRRKGR
jgi:transcriptional regulator with XRE-family HTH domain